MTLDPDLARRLRDHLIAEHNSGRSWRVIAREEFPGVTHSVLQRIAKDGYFPKDRKILRALGLVVSRKRTEVEKRIASMARETNDAVLRRRKHVQDHDRRDKGC